MLEWQKHFDTKKDIDQIKKWRNKLIGINKSVSFNPEEHRYYYQKREFISVSKRLEFMAAGVLAMTGSNIMEDAMQRGTAVHYFTEQHDLNIEKIDLTKQHNDLVPYLKAYMKYLAENEPIFIGVEQKVFYNQWETAGTIDRIYVRKDSKGKLIVGIIDIKTGSHTMKNIHQLHIYASMLSSVLGYRGMIEKYLLYLDKAGRYKLRKVL